MKVLQTRDGRTVNAGYRIRDNSDELVTLRATKGNGYDSVDFEVTKYRRRTYTRPPAYAGWMDVGTDGNGNYGYNSGFFGGVHGAISGVTANSHLGWVVWCLLWNVDDQNSGRWKMTKIERAPSYGAGWTAGDTSTQKIALLRDSNLTVWGEHYLVHEQFNLGTSTSYALNVFVARNLSYKQLVVGQRYSVYKSFITGTFPYTRTVQDTTIGSGQAAEYGLRWVETDGGRDQLTYNPWNKR